MGTGKFNVMCVRRLCSLTLPAMALKVALFFFFGFSIGEKAVASTRPMFYIVN